MLLVGLTGGIASGKSTVSALLAERGAEVIDADHIARQVVMPGTPAWCKLRDHFGPEEGASDCPAARGLAPRARPRLSVASLEGSVPLVGGRGPPPTDDRARRRQHRGAIPKSIFIADTPPASKR